MIREVVKKISGKLLSRATPHCRFDRSIFVLAHMRCGSTALSNILCSHPTVSGYGETHISYESEDGLGRLVLNQWRHKAWQRSARYLFDKILHSRYDGDVPAQFFSSKGIFLARTPTPSVKSIRHLFATVGKQEYTTDDEAASYYLERLDSLMVLWHRFPAENRFGLTFEKLMSEPDHQIALLQDFLKLDPPLRNEYVSHAASTKGGGGDPLMSADHRKIEKRTAQSNNETLDISAEMQKKLEQAYENFITTISEAPGASSKSATVQ